MVQTEVAARKKTRAARRGRRPWLPIMAMVGSAWIPARVGEAQTAGLLPFATGVTEVVTITNAGDGSGRLFLVLQDGRIMIRDGSGVLPTPFLDIQSLVIVGGERGLLGLAFHPSYETNGFFYVDYTREPDGATVIARYKVSADPNVADPASRADMLLIAQPAANHNGGQLQFGPDGYLYIGMGDGGANGCSSQASNTLLGKMLRIDVDQNVGTAPFYGIPPTNPYVGPGDPPDEVWARGLRNPWRFSFDRATNELFIADVGETDREEVDVLPAGAGAADNFGWSVMEGTLCQSSCGGAPPCNDPSLILPKFEYDHSLGRCSITGGYRYRGGSISSLVGRYVYGDLCSGEIFTATESGGTWSTSVLLDTTLTISTFGEDEAGELYVSGYGNATVYKIVGNVMSVSDASVTEGNSGTRNAAFQVTLSEALSQPVSFNYTTTNGTASAGPDYVATSGLRTIPAGMTSTTIDVPVRGDLLDEDDETFSLSLFNPTGAAIGDGQGVGTILDDDPLPALSVDDTGTVEGNAGTTAATFTASLSVPSGRAVQATFASADGTATAGVDYSPASGTVTIPAGATSAPVAVTVLGDTSVEVDETFTLTLSAPLNADLVDDVGTGTIVDDDAPSLSQVELTHGSALWADWGGPSPGVDFYRLAQRPYASYEVVVEGSSGDAVPVTVERLAADNVTVLQDGITPGTGTAVRLAWQNRSGALVTNQHLRLAAACGVACGADDVYRVRLYETTGRVARFNDSGTQLTVLVLQNVTGNDVNGHADFWSAAGTRLASLDFTLAAQETLVSNTATVAGLSGTSGSITVSQDGGLGAVAGKAVALEPSTGFSFDTPLVTLPR